MLISCAKCCVKLEEKMAVTGNLQYYICRSLSSFTLAKWREQNES